MKREELEMALACYEDEVHQLRKQIDDMIKHNQCFRIAEALEARARRIMEGM